MAVTNNADLLAIKAELQNDPKTLGLVAPPAIDDVGNADKLNLVRVELQIDREAVPISEIVKAVDRDEFNALSAADRSWLQFITQGGSINPQTNSEIREGMLQLFAVGTESRTNLTALLTESASRVNQMFKEGLLTKTYVLTPSDIASARNAV